jgi:hypothetical protein
MEILSREAAFVVRAESKGALAFIDDAPGLVPDLPKQKAVNHRTRQKQKATA